MPLIKTYNTAWGKIADNVLLTPVPFNLKLFLIHRKADLFTHEQRIIGLAVAGWETRTG